LGGCGRPNVAATLDVDEKDVIHLGLGGAVASANGPGSVDDEGSAAEDAGMGDSPFRRGDRVEWVGPTESDMGPRHGERGLVVDMDPMDDVIAWDESGTLSGTFRPPWTRRVSDENEASSE
jgi:hypothetical protein